MVTRAMYLASSEVVEAGDLPLPDQEGSGEARKGGGSGGRGRSGENLPAGRSLQGPPRLQVLYQLLRERGTLTTMEYARLAGVSRKTGQRDLALMVRMGWARQVGEKKARVYEFIPPA